MRLSDRIDDVTRWKENLKACAQQVDAEMDALTLVINESIKPYSHFFFSIFFKVILKQLFVHLYLNYLNILMVHF